MKVHIAQMRSTESYRLFLDFVRGTIWPTVLPTHMSIDYDTLIRAHLMSAVDVNDARKMEW